VLGARLKAARVAAELSLRALAAEAGVTAMALSKYERDLMRPSETVLRALAQALHVDVTFFTEDTAPTLMHVEYRASRRMTIVAKRLVNAAVQRQVALRQEIETLVPALAVKFTPPNVGRVTELAHSERVAQMLRDEWGLRLQPIANVTNTLEAHGIAVLQLDVKDGWFDGLSCWVGERPVIVVSRDWPGDRQRFTLAHELGHVVMHGKLAGLDEERACHRFAGAWLAPANAVKQLYIGGEVSPLELWMLKHEWGLSMNAWIYRLRDVGKIREEEARRLWREFRDQGWNEKEPGPGLAGETATRYRRQISGLVANGRIARGIGAELLGVEEEEVERLVGMG
jgi:Zn-dependent peptidase ImmA (M78 family)